MKANENNLKELLGGERQYLVPLYQRTYSWTQKQFKQLWDDLIELSDDFAERPDISHFIGSMVLAPAPTMSPAGVQEWLVVDGQQRLTTLTVLLAAIRDHSADNDPQAVERINELYLINKWAAGPKRYKLTPTQLDRSDYNAVIDRAPSAGSGEGIGAAYRYFRSQLERLDDPGDPHDIRRLEDAVTTGLSIVVISAQQGDNVHRIFESLNNTGVRLTQADLLRNYFFMRMPSRGETAYHTLWLPMQQALKPDEIELVVWLDLVLRGEEKVRRDDIYKSQQTRLEHARTEEELEAELASLCRRAELLRVILDPELEDDQKVREGLTRLKDWGAQTVYPSALHLLELRASGHASSEQLARSFRLLESYLVRRLIAGKPTNNLNRILNGLPAEVTGESEIDDEVHRYLSTGRKYWPTDAELRDAVETGPFYWRGRVSQRTFILRRLEESYGSKEPVDLSSLTIEHVMPQSPSDSWWEELAGFAGDDEDVQLVHQQLVHTLGNLTLTGYNSTLSNRPFAEKREELRRSGLRMNQEIAGNDRWTPEEIRGRSASLADRCIALWPGPIEGLADEPTEEHAIQLSSLLAATPPGAWTTYGDISEVLGMHVVAIGSALAAHDIPNRWRVLNGQGVISPWWNWGPSARDEDPTELLRAEGVNFLDSGAAHPSQRLGADDLADLIGLEREDPGLSNETLERREQFERQLDDAQPVDVAAAARDLLGRWRDAGGSVVYGSGEETSAILKLFPYGHTGYALWCAAIYPSGSLAIWFQFLKTKEPFNDPQLREELRERLDAVEGIELPESKLGLRPSIPLAVLARPDATEQVAAALGFIIERSAQPVDDDDARELSEASA